MPKAIKGNVRQATHDVTWVACVLSAQQIGYCDAVNNMRTRITARQSPRL